MMIGSLSEKNRIVFRFHWSIQKIMCELIQKLCIYTVDGGYGPWSSFGECSVTCGNGVQKRERSCDSPAPMFGGLSCDKLELGSSDETKECKKDMCPGEILVF